MTADELITKICTHAYTRAEVHRHLWLLRSYCERRWFGSGDAGTLASFYGQEANPRGHAVAGDLGDDVGGLTKDTLYRVFDEAEELVKTLPFVAISIPFTPTDETIVAIGSWFRNNVNPRTVFEVTVDPRVVGGCAFAHRGYYQEFALHRAITNKKEDIRSMLKDYADKETKQ